MARLTRPTEGERFDAHQPRSIEDPSPNRLRPCVACRTILRSIGRATSHPIRLPIRRPIASIARTCVARTSHRASRLVICDPDDEQRQVAHPIVRSRLASFTRLEQRGVQMCALSRAEAQLDDAPQCGCGRERAS